MPTSSAAMSIPSSSAVATACVSFSVLKCVSGRPMLRLAPTKPTAAPASSSTMKSANTFQAGLRVYLR